MRNFYKLMSKSSVRLDEYLRYRRVLQDSDEEYVNPKKGKRSNKDKEGQKEYDE